uniref:6-phosphogluconolactonase n=1 Tax=Verrucosispora sioxanthis TaxID=2499994 RepID=UPI0038B6527D
MLGVGEDGHVASVFPEHPVHYESRPVSAVRAVRSPHWYASPLTLPAINTAEEGGWWPGRRQGPTRSAWRWPVPDRCSAGGRCRASGVPSRRPGRWRPHLPARFRSLR